MKHNKLTLSLLFATTFVAVIGLLLSRNSQASLASGDPYEGAAIIVDEATEALHKGDVAGMFEVVRKYWPIPDSEVTALKNATLQKRKVATSRYGKSLGLDLGKLETFGKCFVRFVYIERFEHHAIVWMFTLYKPADTWTVNTISWNDDVNAWLK